MPENETEYKNVRESWPIYDTVLIGLTEQQAAKYPGGFTTFAAMSAQDEIPFLNIRNSSEAGLAYTNISSKDKTPWPYYLDSFGMRFIYPSPNANASSEHSAEVQASKIFEGEILDHCYFQFTIREDVVLTIKPAMMPAGFGPTGFMIGNSTQNSIFSDNMTNGNPDMRNRWRNVGASLMIPRDTPIKGSLRFSEYGKMLLQTLNAVAGYDFAEEEPVQALARIELTLFGKRDVQQRGEWHYE
jgi:hypothetical protein